MSVITRREKKRSAVGCGPFTEYQLALQAALLRQRRGGENDPKGRRRPIFAILKKRNGSYLVYSNHAYAIRMSLLHKQGLDPALLGMPVAYVLASGKIYEL